MKQTFLFFLFLIPSFEVVSQVSSYDFSINILFSDISSLAYDGAVEESNSWKRGFEFRSGVTFNIYKKWSVLDIALSYNERKALEFFPFPFGEEGQQFGNINSVFAYGDVPTSPQHKDFYTSVFEYIHFPNFKYLHLSLIPKLRLSHHKFSFEGGVGFFGGLLVNRNQLIFGEEYFPWAAFDFGPPHNVYGDVRYHRYDFGWVTDISFHYKINDLWKIGIAGKSYQSLVRLNDTFVAPTLYHNTRWIAYTLGLEVTYLVGG